jgi:hypothetical protein
MVGTTPIEHAGDAIDAKVGFAPIGEADAPAPLPLTQPQGWPAQSLTGRPMTPLKGPSRCVEALENPLFWSGASPARPARVRLAPGWAWRGFLGRFCVCPGAVPLAESGRHRISGAESPCCIAYSSSP